MPTATFYQPTTGGPAGTTAHPTTGSYAVGADLTVSVAGVSAVGLYFQKTAGDSTVNRGAAIYKVSDHSVVASATFTGETASGWQYVAFASPVPLSTGVTYRVATNVNANYTYYSGYTNSGTIVTGAQLGGGSYVGSTTLMYPSNADATDYYGIDVLLDGVSRAATSLNASQVLAEAWVRITAPPTELRASQVLAEAWTTETPIQLVASQVLAEVWLRPAVAPTYRRLQVSAQVI